jgi:hypothetical protein
MQARAETTGKLSTAAALRMVAAQAEKWKLNPREKRAFRNAARAEQPPTEDFIIGKPLPRRKGTTKYSRGSS